MQIRRWQLEMGNKQPPQTHYQKPHQILVTTHPETKSNYQNLVSYQNHYQKKRRYQNHYQNKLPLPERYQTSKK